MEHTLVADKAVIPPETGAEIAAIPALEQIATGLALELTFSYRQAEGESSRHLLQVQQIWQSADGAYHLFGPCQNKGGADYFSMERMTGIRIKGQNKFIGRGELTTLLLQLKEAANSPADPSTPETPPPPEASPPVITAPPLATAPPEECPSPAPPAIVHQKDDPPEGGAAFPPASPALQPMDSTPWGELKITPPETLILAVLLFAYLAMLHH